MADTAPKGGATRKEHFNFEVIGSQLEQIKDRVSDIEIQFEESSLQGEAVLAVLKDEEVNLRMLLQKSVAYRLILEKEIVTVTEGIKPLNKDIAVLLKLEDKLRSYRALIHVRQRFTSTVAYYASYLYNRVRRFFKIGRHVQATGSSESDDSDSELGNLTSCSGETLLGIAKKRAEIRIHECQLLFLKAQINRGHLEGDFALEAILDVEGNLMETLRDRLREKLTMQEKILEMEKKQYIISGLESELNSFTDWDPAGPLSDYFVYLYDKVNNSLRVLRSSIIEALIKMN